MRDGHFVSAGERERRERYRHDTAGGRERERGKKTGREKLAPATQVETR